MTDLYELVLHHIEGEEIEVQRWNTSEGEKVVEFKSFGPDRWIEDVHELGRMWAIDCLALIFFVVDDFYKREQACRIVDDWAVELRKAVSTDEIQARDPVTLLALEALPDGWEWLISMADADKFIAARGMNWRFGEVVLHLFKECEQKIQERRFPPWTWEPKKTAPTVSDTSQEAQAQMQATPEPVQEVATIDYTALATPEELIAAFGTFTGMGASWFVSLKDTPALLAARKVPGTPGRKPKPPLFCPYEVMLWLTDEGCKKCKPIQTDTGWRILKRHFPRAYEPRAIGEPDNTYRPG